jgi:hypothetical protein
MDRKRRVSSGCSGAAGSPSLIFLVAQIQLDDGDNEKSGKATKEDGEQRPTVNPWNGRPYTSRYFSILKTRKTLPVYEHREAFEKALREHQIVLLVGETGSGKTTQIPQFVAEMGFTANGKRIACTQPRRVAAMSVSRRVSEEMDVELGAEVGYKVRRVLRLFLSLTFGLLDSIRRPDVAVHLLDLLVRELVLLLFLLIRSSEPTV